MELSQHDTHRGGVARHAARYIVAPLLIILVLVLVGCSQPAGESGEDGIEPLAPVAPEAPVPEAEEDLNPNVVLTAEAGGERDFELAIGIAPALASGDAEGQEALFRGAQLAIQQVNDSEFMGNGRRMALVMGDRPVTDMTTAGEYEEPLFVQGLVAVLGPVLTGNSGEPTVPLVLLRDAGVVNDTGSGSVSEWAFGVGQTAGELSLETVQALEEILSLDSLALIYPASDPDVVGRAVDVLQQEMPETQIVISQDVDADADLMVALEAVAETNPDAVLLLLPTPLAARVLMAAAEMGLTQNAQFIGGAGVVSPAIFAETNGAAETLIGGTDWYAVAPAELEGFAEAYEAMFDAESDEIAARAYTAIWLLAEAVRQVGSADRGPLQDGLAQLENSVQTPVGSITFAERPLRTPLLLEIGPQQQIRAFEME